MGKGNLSGSTVLVIVVVIIIVLLLIWLFVAGSIANTEEKLHCNLLPRDHTVVSCTKPLEFGVKVITSHKKIVVFKVYDGEILLWTSERFTIDEVTQDVYLKTNIAIPPPLFRVDMCLADSGTVVSKLVLETQCVGAVNEVKILNPPLKGCTMLVSTPFNQERPENALGSTGWQTAIIAVPRCFIGKSIRVD